MPKVIGTTMGDMNGTNEKERDVSNNRPFYELPAHIKACSKIIQETRMQLKHSKRFPSSEITYTGQSRGDLFGSVGLRHRRSTSDLDNDHVTELPNINNESYVPNGLGYSGIKPVDTKRPFTPRDNVSLWGVSARKRPPSAITLSRLAVFENDDEEKVLSPLDINDHLSESSNSHKIAAYPTPKAYLGKVPKLQLAATRPGYSFDSATEVLGGLNSKVPSRKMSGDVERTRVYLKSLSLQTDVLTQPQCNGDQDTETGKDVTDLPGKLYSDNFPTNHNFAYIKDLSEQGSPPVFQLKERLSHPNQTNGKLVARSIDVDQTRQGHINYEGSCDKDLNIAVNHLQSLVVDFLTSQDKNVHEEIVFALKKVRECIDDLKELPQLRSKLLRLVFKLVEQNQTNEDVLFWASFVLLHCNVIGNNLTTILKMVFKASRSTELSEIIKQTDFLDVFMGAFEQICPETQTEAMIYGYGTLKFICMDASVLFRCIELNLIPIMTRHLRALNIEVSRTIKELPESLFNATFQLTSILRSVVGEDSNTLDKVIRSGLLEELCNSLYWTVADIDVASNVVRILSVISMDETCCFVISSNDHFIEAVLRVFTLWKTKDDVMVRMTYCLGNLFAKNDEIRLKLFDREGSVQLILNLISYHVKKPTPVSMDILVKTVRVVANWILNPTIGWEVSDCPQLAELLYSVLLINHATDELILCVISTLNNTSFYKDYNAIDDFTLQTAEYLFCNVISTRDVEVKAEAMKVLGNLSRNPDIRCAAADYVENLLNCLDEESDEELICSTCGVLVNIIVDESVKSKFLQLNGVSRMIDILRNWDALAVVMMVNQILWNLTISNIENDGFENYGIGEENKSEIRKLLFHKLQILEAINSENDSVHYKQSEYDLQSEFYNDFETVVKGLLEKL